MSSLRIGDPVRVSTTTEVMTLVAIDGDDAWLRYEDGGHKAERVEDLEYAHSKPWYQIKADLSAEMEPA